MIFSVTEAKAKLSQLIERALAGEPIVVTRRGAPVVQLTSLETVEEAASSEKHQRVPGAWKGRFELPDSFFDPLPDDELAGWEGR